VSGEIEFVDPGSGPELVPPARHRSGVAGWIAALGWTAATALAVIAPFQRLYGTGLPPRYADYLPASGGVNGWGNGDGSGPRFGIILVVCAAVCAALALSASARMVTARRPGAGRRVLAGTSVAAPCLLAGAVGTLALFLASDPDTTISSAAQGAIGFTAYVPLNQDQAFSSNLSVTFTGSTVGHSWCLWLAVAALVCGVVAAVAQSAANRPERDLAG